MSESLTTNQLAARIAFAVMKAHGIEPGTRAAAVLEVLRETGHWFCRLSEDPKQGTVQQVLPLE